MNIWSDDMSWINTFVHSEFFFYGLIVLFLIVLIIFGIVVYFECKKLKINQAREHALKLAKEEKMDKFAAHPKEEKKKLEKQVEVVSLEPEKKEVTKESIKESITSKESTKTSASMNDIESLLSRMKKDLTEKEEQEIECFEQEQEEQAIISYEELVRAAKEKQALEMDEEGNTPISNRELEVALEKKRQKELEEERKREQEKKSGFHTTQFISPVYGIQEEKKKKESFQNSFQELKLEPVLEEVPELPDELELPLETSLPDGIEVESIQEDANKNAEFLDALKEFRKNLE
ncbi:MAG: hypothetical protein KH135_01025 [Firmicutes bacterium]|nr:hypothetical protein [Bacillota bacterium]